MRRRKRSDGLIEDVVRGAVAGAAATWVMGRATTFLYDREDERARKREEEARGGGSAYGSAAAKLAGLAGRELTKAQEQRAGSALHWALGATGGAIYGALRGRVPVADAGAGLLFGTAFFLLMDEGANTLLGLTPGPSAFPWQAHARGLAGHLVYGVTANAALEAMSRV